MPTVDTLKAYETLTAADMPEKQAKAMVAIVQELQEARLTDIATKEDIAAIRSEMQGLRTEIYRVKFDLLKWIIPILLGQLGLTVAILFRLLR